MSDTETLTTLTDFLLARIAEDESEAEHVTYQVNRYPEEAVGLRDRVLAECEAKRRIVEWATTEGHDAWGVGPVLSILALPYADHPDYREEWRP